MKNTRIIGSLFILSLCLTLFLQAEEIAVRSPEGEYLLLEVARDETFSHVIGRLEDIFDEQENSQGNAAYDERLAVQYNPRDFWLDFRGSNTSPQSAAKSMAAMPRSYPAGLSQQERDDIAFIVTTLAKNSPIKILKYKSTLEKAGERLDRVHPLRFLQCILISEELKTGMRVIRQKSLIWKDFFKGIKTSLSEEAALNNLAKEYIDDFAASLHLNPALLYAPLAEHRWLDFTDLLIKLVPRNGNTERYDM